MDANAIANILNRLNRGIYDEAVAGCRDEFRRGRGIGIQRGVEKTLNDLGYEVVWEEDEDGNPVAVGISEVA